MSAPPKAPYTVPVAEVIDRANLILVDLRQALSRHWPAQEPPHREQLILAIATCSALTALAGESFNGAVDDLGLERAQLDQVVRELVLPPPVTGRSIQ